MGLRVRMRKTAKKTGTVSKAVRRYVKKQVHANVENKFFVLDLNTYWASVGTVWIERDICYPSQGTGISNRVGQEISIRSIEIKGVIVQGSNESSLDDSYNVMRVVIALYNANSFTPLADATTTINQPITGVLNTAGQMLKKLLDKYIVLTVTSTEKGAGDGYTPAVKTFNYYKYFKTPLRVRYGDATTLVQNRRLMMSVISDSGAIVNPGFEHGYIKVMYEDA